MNKVVEALAKESRRAAAQEKLKELRKVMLNEMCHANSSMQCTDKCVYFDPGYTHSEHRYYVAPRCRRRRQER
jgi:hypothetical protein